MNYPVVIKLLSGVLRIEMAAMIVPLVVSLLYGGDDAPAFIYSIVILAFVSFLLSMIKPSDTKFRTKEGFMSVALAWLTVSVFGALPFYFCGYFNTLADCMFESISGFTTTGATILTDIQSLPRGIIFWRGFMHWIGGMGVLMFMLAIMPGMSASSVNLLRVEGTGPSVNKMLPKLRESAKIMYLIYLSMTAVLTVLLCIAGLPVYDSIVHAFSCAGTGGFSSMNFSISAYNNVAVECIITVFIFLFGVNFTLFFYLLRKEFKLALLDEELLFYAAIVLFSIVVITVDIMPLYHSIATSLRHSSFQVVSVITTTGFASVDYNTWPTFSRLVLVLIMFTGCCAGSTGGGIKLVRVLVLFKCVGVELSKIIHPKVVKNVKLNSKPIDDKVVYKVFMFFFIYFAILICSILLISIENKDMVSSVTAVISTLSNVGPGFDVVGPMGNYSSFSSFSKVIMSFCMLAGRLELFPVLVLFVPSVWKNTSSL